MLHLCLIFAATALAMAAPIKVQLAAKNAGECGRGFKNYFWIPRSQLAPLGMPTKETCVSNCGSVTINGESYDLNQINVADGHDVCKVCNCDLAYIQLSKSEVLDNVHCGDTVAMSYSTNGSWTTIHDMALRCTSAEFKGDLGPKTTATDCLNSAKALSDVNYALYRGDGDNPKRCYVCAITDRGPPSNWNYTKLVGATSFASTRTPRPPKPPPHPPGPSPPGPHWDVAGIYLELAAGAFTAQSVNKSVHGVWNKTNNFSFVGSTSNRPRQGCHLLGDLTLRVAPANGSATGGAGGTPWAIYDSAYGTEDSWKTITEVKGLPHALIAHDITNILDASTLPPTHNNSMFERVPVRVVRSWEKSADGQGLVLRFNITNRHGSPITIGGLGMPMPQAGQQHGIEESVWNDPHIGGDHGFVEWVRVVVDEQTMLATAEGAGSGFESWRPIMEDKCESDDWEWTVHSKAWAEEWEQNKQFPYLQMADYLAKAVNKIDGSLMWPKPHTSPWPSWHGKGNTIPITNFSGYAMPWNTPTSATLGVGESRDYAVRLTMANGGPRTRNDALLKAGRSVLRAVPGYVLGSDMTSAQLFVTSPPGVRLVSVTSSAPHVLTAKITEVETVTHPEGGMVTLPFTVLAITPGVTRGRARLRLEFSDGSEHFAHYSVLPPLREQVSAVGRHWSEDAWLPRDYPDPFGRSASVMPWDRVWRTWVLDDSRAYDVGLSDDAGGGNPLGFAIKVAYSPNQFQVTRLDDYVKWTLFGVKTDTALPPYKSLQIRPEDCIPSLGNKDGSQCGNEDGIRMTMYYYGTDFNNSHGGFSGHWPYNYSEADKIGAPGIEGGPNWPMTEHMANATYRAFNFPHHVTTYLSLYYAARNTNLTTYHPWSWYLMRAANTTIKFGTPSVGVMDDTTFREILRALNEEAEDGENSREMREAFANATAIITANMYTRAAGFGAKEYPYGSEFAFDTTGQEAVVVWLLHFANDTNTFELDAKRTVDHILSYMRSSPTWAYNGGSRSWGDLGNNGKWQATSGAHFETRGNFHYRSGLNSIPLLEWYLRHPDDTFLLEPALGAVAGQMNNIDENGAPSMMMHMEPHIQEFDPHSGDFGLGFFGCSLQSRVFYVHHPSLGGRPVCYLCNIRTDTNSDTKMDKKLDKMVQNVDNKSVVTITPTDLYHRRVYLEPLALDLTLDAGTFASLSLDFEGKQITITFEPAQANNYTYSVRRLRVEKMSDARPGGNFVLTPTMPVKRGAYVIPVDIDTVKLSW